MTLLDHLGATLKLEPADGEHSCVLVLTEGKTELEFYMRPDDAFALSATLTEWARDRTNKGGMF